MSLLLMLKPIMDFGPAMPRQQRTSKIDVKAELRKKLKKRQKAEDELFFILLKK